MAEMGTVEKQEIKDSWRSICSQAETLSYRDGRGPVISAVAILQEVAKYAHDDGHIPPHSIAYIEEKLERLRWYYGKR
jgi:hypothetical protein